MATVIRAVSAARSGGSRSRRTIRSSAVGAVVGGLALASAATAAGAITGSGSSFAGVAYRAWCQDSGSCTYTAKGSTGGINDLIAGVVDFAGSDAPLSDQQLQSLGGQRGGTGVLYFPTLLGAISVPTNIDGVSGRIRIDGKTLAKIFDGKITSWNDRAITSQNRGTTLPARPITVCVRSDGSGTSFNFSRYLTKSDTAFGQQVGFSTLPNWTAPNLVKGPQNSGVANCVKSNSNSIGYVDLADAINAGLGGKVSAVGRAQLRTVRQRVVVKVHGKKQVRFRKVRRPVVGYVLPSPATIAAAADNARAIPRNLLADLTLSSKPGAYPIVITTWVLAYSDYGKAGKAGAKGDVVSMLKDFYGSADQGKLVSLGYAPLPKSLLAKGVAQIGSIR